MKLTKMTVAISILSLVGFAANSSAASKSAVRCRISGVALAQPGPDVTIVAATGKCARVNPKTHKLTAVSASWTHRTLSLSDQLGYGCSVPPVFRDALGGRSFPLQPIGAYAAKVSFTLTSKKERGLPSASVSKTFTVAPHGNRLSCARLGIDVQPLRDVSRQCPWQDAQFSSFFVCSAPIAGACGFVQPANMSGLTITSGYVACPGGSCLPVLEGIGGSWFGKPVGPEAEYTCADGTTFTVGTLALRLTSPGGQTCTAIRPAPFPTTFSVSPFIGGRLEVTFFVSSASLGTSQAGRAYQETGSFMLGGNADGCPQLLQIPAEHQR